MTLKARFPAIGSWLMLNTVLYICVIFIQLEFQIKQNNFKKSSKANLCHPPLFLLNSPDITHPKYLLKDVDNGGQGFCGLTNTPSVFL